MNFFSKKPTIAVHSGIFHADDVFAAAMLELAIGRECEIVRTRDEDKIRAADYVADVGGIHDEATNRFDHHQKGGAGTHANGIPYAACGLVWKKYGAQICGSQEIADRIEERLVCPIDADDNGYATYEPIGTTVPFTLQGFLYLKRPTWREDASMNDASFLQLVPVAKDILLREIKITGDYLLAIAEVEKAYAEASDKRCIELSESFPFNEVLSKYPEPLYILTQRKSDLLWKLEGVRANPTGFEIRSQFPASWAGLRDTELEQATGVLGAVFCHNGRWLIVAKTKEAIQQLANLALNG